MSAMNFAQWLIGSQWRLAAWMAFWFIIGSGIFLLGMWIGWRAMHCHCP